MHVAQALRAVLGLDGPNGPGYLFWSGIGSFLPLFVGGVVGYIRIRRKHEKMKRDIHDHISQQFTKLTEKIGE